MLDEMDGKQARATTNSSPLGLIFDHGCDCFTTGIQVIILLKILQCGNNALSYVMLMTVYACFHFATLEEHYVGILRLPVCNAVSDGSVIMIMLFLATGIFGNEFWAKGVADGKWLHIEGLQVLTIGQLLVMFVITTGTFNYIANFMRIIKSASVPYEGQSEKVEKCRLIQ